VIVDGTWFYDQSSATESGLTFQGMPFSIGSHVQCRYYHIDCSSGSSRCQIAVETVMIQERRRCTYFVSCCTRAIGEVLYCVLPTATTKYEEMTMTKRDPRHDEVSCSNEKVREVWLRLWQNLCTIYCMYTFQAIRDENLPLHMI